MEAGRGGGVVAAHAAAAAGVEKTSASETTTTTTPTPTLFGRLRLALSRRTSSASSHGGGGSTKQTPFGSRRGSATAEREADTDFLGTSSRGKTSSSSLSSSAATATTTTNNPNAGLSLSQLLMEKRPLDLSIPLPETGKGARPGDGGVEFGFSLSRGRRLAMEDFHVAAFETHPSIPGKGTIGTFGVFDGHGGDRAAAFVSRELFRSVLSSEEFASGDAARALSAGFLATDRAYLLSGGGGEEEEEPEELTRRHSSNNKVLVKVRSMFNKGFGGRNGSGEIGNGSTGNGTGTGTGSTGNGHSSYLGLSPPPPALSGALSGSSNGGGGLASSSSSSLSPPLTPTEGASPRDDGALAPPRPPPPPAPPVPAVSTPSPSRQRAPPRDDGCTAAVALVLGDERLLVAHVGDSRAVLVEPASSDDDEAKKKRGGGSGSGGKKSSEHSSSTATLPPFTARALSTDHKPNRPDERARIEAAGGAVLWAGTWRVGGVLAVSRAFGDSALKLTSGVVADPDVREEKLKRCPSASSFASFAPLLILATDGIWDALSTDEAASIALAHSGDLEAAARALTTAAWEQGSPDNATAVVVRLGGSGGGPKEREEEGQKPAAA